MRLLQTPGSNPSWTLLGAWPFEYTTPGHCPRVVNPGTAIALQYYLCLGLAVGLQIAIVGLLRWTPWIFRRQAPLSNTRGEASSPCLGWRFRYRDLTPSSLRTPLGLLSGWGWFLRCCHQSLRTPPSVRHYVQHSVVMHGAGSGQGSGNYLPFVNPLSRCHIPRCLSLCHFNYHPSTPSAIFILHLVEYYPVWPIIIRFRSIITQSGRICPNPVSLRPHLWSYMWIGVFWWRADLVNN